MTVQNNLDLIWALTGGTTDPGDVKYSTGWIAEIPTFQNFNFVLQNNTKNLLVLAENGAFDWQTEITYRVGGIAYEAGIQYFCITANSGNQPSLDNTESFWIKSPSYGTGAVNKLLGLSVRGATARLNDGVWTTSDMTLENKSALLQLNTDNASIKNWLIGNVKGELVVVDCDLEEFADGRDIDPATGAKSYRMFHEGHAPEVSEISGAVEEAPQDSKVYSRKNAGWEVTTSTVVSTAPPPASVGAGAGWYNLDDGKLYVDIDDGDSSQWVLSSPVIIPELPTGILVADDIGVSVQGFDATILNAADIGVNVEAFDNTILKDSDIGVTVQAYDVDTAKLDVVQSFTAEQTFKEVKETQFSLTGTVIDPANGTLQYKTLASNITFTESLVDGQAVTLMIDDGSSFTVTWPTIIWVGGSAPLLPTSGFAVIELWQINSVLYGMHSGDV